MSWQRIEVVIKITHSSMIHHTEEVEEKNVKVKGKNSRERK